MSVETGKSTEGELQWSPPLGLRGARTGATPRGRLTWESRVGVPLLLMGAKLLGLYDRDEALLRKTTLDEAPKLFQLATLCTVVAWMAGGLIVHGILDRPEALVLWLSLAGLLIMFRSAARGLSLRIAPAERCL